MIMSNTNHPDDPRLKQRSSDDKHTGRVSDDSDIIELSDIAIGTTPEDDMIVELTEEVIDEAMIGISGATRDKMKEGEEILDLSKVEPEKDNHFMAREKHGAQTAEPEITSSLQDLVAEEDHISKELDEFFDVSQETSSVTETPVVSIQEVAQPVVPKTDAVISDATLMEALETVIQKRYGDKINQLIAETIEKIVVQEINRIKKILTQRTNQ